jgi:hypothetical protein
MQTKRKIIWAAIIVLLLCLVIYAFSVRHSSSDNDIQYASNVQRTVAYATVPTIDLADASYNVDGTQYALAEGVSTTLRLYQATYGDLNNDGKPDAAVILINEPGGSGDFTYVAAAIDGGTTTPAVLLGDRIETDGINIDNGVITVYYKDRSSTAAMTTPPTIPEVAHYIVANGELVAQQ